MRESKLIADTIDGIAKPVHKKAIVKCCGCGGTMEKENTVPLYPEVQIHKPYLMDIVTYKCPKCICSFHIETEYRTDKFGEWIRNTSYLAKEKLWEKQND